MGLGKLVEELVRPLLLKGSRYVSGGLEPGRAFLRIGVQVGPEPHLFHGVEVQLWREERRVKAKVVVKVRRGDILNVNAVELREEEFMELVAPLLREIAERRRLTSTTIEIFTDRVAEVLEGRLELVERWVLPQPGFP
ncbi:MAG: hypothetical protein DRK00_10810 [Thermoprotei archaeon]|nr:MAG: hypothetical protein DRK00_10810 [Thermoprotei archaeon]